MSATTRERRSAHVTHLLSILGRNVDTPAATAPSGPVAKRLAEDRQAIEQTGSRAAAILKRLPASSVVAQDVGGLQARLHRLNALLAIPVTGDGADDALRPQLTLLETEMQRLETAAADLATTESKATELAGRAKAQINGVPKPAQAAMQSLLDRSLAATREALAGATDASAPALTQACGELAQVAAWVEDASKGDANSIQSVVLAHARAELEDARDHLRTLAEATEADDPLLARKAKLPGSATRLVATAHAALAGTSADAMQAAASQISELTAELSRPSPPDAPAASASADATTCRTALDALRTALPNHLLSFGDDKAKEEWHKQRADAFATELELLSAATEARDPHVVAQANGKIQALKGEIDKYQAALEARQDPDGLLRHNLDQIQAVLGGDEFKLDPVTHSALSDRLTALWEKLSGTASTQPLEAPAAALLRDVQAKATDLQVQRQSLKAQPALIAKMADAHKAPDAAVERDYLKALERRMTALLSGDEVAPGALRELSLASQAIKDRKRLAVLAAQDAADARAAQALHDDMKTKLAQDENASSETIREQAKHMQSMLKSSFKHYQGDGDLDAFRRDMAVLERQRAAPLRVEPPPAPSLTALAKRWSWRRASRPRWRVPMRRSQGRSHKCCAGWRRWCRLTPSTGTRPCWRRRLTRRPDGCARLHLHRAENCSGAGAVILASPSSSATRSTSASPVSARWRPRCSISRAH